VLSYLGRREEALSAAEEAAALFRELARARSEPFTPDLAGSLSNLAAALSGLGRWEEALAAAEEAVALRRELARARPAVFTRPLIASLALLGRILLELNRTDEANRIGHEIQTTAAQHGIDLASN
jgi:tetratricopeptide (TPR) repeat protein